MELAKVIIERIHQFTNDVQFKYGDVSLAMGVATKIEQEENMFKVFRLAEELMYQEKNNVAPITVNTNLLIFIC